MHLIFLNLFLILVLGCSPSDPYKKLDYAQEYFDVHGYVARSQWWVTDAIDICKSRKDNQCLSKAYLTYGLLLKSKFFDRMSCSRYGRFRYHDPSINNENRLVKVEEYFDKALALKPKGEAIYSAIEKARNDTYISTIDHECSGK